MYNYSKYTNIQLLLFVLTGVLLGVFLPVPSFAQQSFGIIDSSIFPSHIQGEYETSWVDYDLDGNIDVLLNGENSVLLINEDGIFRDATQELMPSLTQHTGNGQVLWGDLNNDGNIDCVRNISSLDTIAYEIYLQNNFGTFSTPLMMSNQAGADIVLQLNQKIKEIGLFDFDEDGDLDLYIENQKDEVEFLCNHTISQLNSNSQLFTSQKIAPRFNTEMLVGWSESSSIAEEWEKGDKRNIFDAFYDLDNDGDFDAIAISPLGVTAWINKGKGNWKIQKNAFQLGKNTNITTVEGGDLDNDGDIDLILYGHSHTYILMNDSDGELRFSEPQILSSLHSCSDLKIVDIDGDGNLDIYAQVAGKHQVIKNNLINDTYLKIDILDKKIADFTSSKYAHGASVLLRDLNGNVISGLQKISGGLGEGKQRNLSLHFGFPAQHQEAIILEIHAPSNYVNDNLDKNTVISKIVYPSQVPFQKVIVTMSEKTKVKMM